MLILSALSKFRNLSVWCFALFLSQLRLSLSLNALFQSVCYKTLLHINGRVMSLQNPIWQSSRWLP